MVPVSINLINNLFGHPPNTSAEVAPRERRKEKKGGQNRNYFDFIAKSTDVSSRTFCRASLSLSFSTVLHSGYAFDETRLAASLRDKNPISRIRVANAFPCVRAYSRLRYLRRCTCRDRGRALAR